MKDRRTPQSLSSILGFFRNMVALVWVRPLLGKLEAVPVRVRRGSPSGLPRRISPSSLGGSLPLLVGFVLLAAMPVWAGQPTLPAGVPNIYDPEVRAQFQPVGVANLLGNPDFPVLHVVNRDGEQPQAFLIGLDARNGKATWSLTTDPIILIVVFSQDRGIQAVYVDVGFADRGKASGEYAAVDETNSPALPELLKAVAEAARRTHI